jgi:hypothetical protein
MGQDGAEEISMGLLGKSKKEAWSEFAENMGAETVDEGAFKGGLKVRLPYKNWEIVMDNYTVSTGKSSTTYTRVRAIYVADAEFDFKIFKKTAFTKMAKALGRQYAYTGNDAFDEKLAIRSLDESKVKKIFEGQKLKDMLMALKRVYFYTKKTKGRKETKYVEGEKEIYYQTLGIIKDEDILTLIFGIMVNMLDAFLENGIAKDEAPQISYLT